MNDSRSAEFILARTAHLAKGKHKSLGPEGSEVYNPPMGSSTGKHSMNYSTPKSHLAPGKHSAGYTGRHR